jgi:hypothetical protein
MVEPDRPQISMYYGAENMLFSCQITYEKYRHTDLIKCIMTTFTVTETAQQFRCHYNLFSQIVHLKKAMRKLTFSCFNATSGTLQEELQTFYCCAQNALSCFHCNSGYTTLHHVTLYVQCLSC